MELLKTIGFCVICLPAVLLLRKITPEHAFLLIVALLTVTLVQCLSVAYPLLEKIGALFEQAGMERNYGIILLKTVAATLVTHFSADLCRDGGSQSLASAVETSGAVAAALITLPLLEAVIHLLQGFFA